MTDEKYLFVTDVADKKRTARGSHNKRTHCGRGGRVRLPSDNLTRKELNKMNGDVKSYRLNNPMTWTEFKTMPDDLKITYIKLLREKFNVPGTHIEKMLGTNHVYYSKEIVRLGLSEGKSSRSGSTPWDMDGWNAWCNRTTSANEEQEEIPATEEACDPVPIRTEQTNHASGIYPVCILSIKDRETIERMLGYIEGLATGVINERLREGLYTAVETISEVLDKGGKA